jgi:hypothetical protein
VKRHPFSLHERSERKEKDTAEHGKMARKMKNFLAPNLKKERIASSFAPHSSQ